MPLKKPKYAEKICDMHTLLKYAKMRQSAKYAAIAYSRFSDTADDNLLENENDSSNMMSCTKHNIVNASNY